MILQDFENAFALLTAQRFSSSTPSHLTIDRKAKAEKILALSGIEKFAKLLNTLAENLKIIPADELKDYFEQAQSVLPVLEEERSIEDLKTNLCNFLVALSHHRELTEEQINQVTDVFTQWAKCCKQADNKHKDKIGEGFLDKKSETEDKEDKDLLFAASYRPTSMILVQQRSPFDDLIKKTQEAMEDALESFFEMSAHLPGPPPKPQPSLKPLTLSPAINIARNSALSYSNAGSTLFSHSPPKPRSSSKQPATPAAASAIDIASNDGTALSFERQVITPRTTFSNLFSTTAKNDGLANTAGIATDGATAVTDNPDGKGVVGGFIPS